MYPVMLNVKGKKCTVVGGGSVALRKAKKLMECGAEVTAVSPQFISGFEDITKIQVAYEVSCIENSFLVIAATDDKKLNKSIFEDAKARGILVSLADDAEHSDFMSPASRTEDNISVAVSTHGRFPLLAKKLCQIKSDDIEFYNTILPALDYYRKRVLSECRDTKNKLLEFMICDEMIECAKQDIGLWKKKIEERI